MSLSHLRRSAGLWDSEDPPKCLLSGVRVPPTLRCQPPEDGPRPPGWHPPGVLLRKLPLSLHVEHEVPPVDVLYDQEQPGEEREGDRG